MIINYYFFNSKPKNLEYGNEKAWYKKAKKGQKNKKVERHVRKK